MCNRPVHMFDGAERSEYVASLAAVTRRHGGTPLVLCFSVGRAGCGCGRRSRTQVADRHDH